MRITQFIPYVLFCGTLSAFAAPTSVTANHPILGAWKWITPNQGCSEVYHYKADGTNLFSSGAEEGTSQYEITATPNFNGFYKLIDHNITDNGKKDCRGIVVQAGVNSILFVHFLPIDGQMVMCYKESLDACFGPLTRQKEF